MKKIKLMSHLIAGYPDKETALIAARSLVKGGADILEIQLPFSDPSADGPAIQTACTKVLEKGYKTSEGLEFIHELHKGDHGTARIHQKKELHRILTGALPLKFKKAAVITGGIYGSVNIKLCLGNIKL